MADRLTEFPDRRVWNLTGFTLEQIRIGYLLTFLFSGPDLRLPGSRTFPVPPNSLWVDIETPFTLRAGSHTDYIVPVQVLTVHPVLRLLHQQIASLTAFRNSTLLLTFEDGSEIEVLQDEQYESWNTFGEGEVADIGMLGSGHEGPPWGEWSSDIAPSVEPY
jgi:hypothetical protein